MFFSLFLSLSADVFDLGRIWIRCLYLSPPKRLAFTFISNLVLAICIFFFHKASSKPCDPLLLLHLSWDFDLEKILEGLYGNMEKIFQFWTLDTYLPLLMKEKELLKLHRSLIPDVFLM